MPVFTCCNVSPGADNLDSADLKLAELAFGLDFTPFDRRLEERCTVRP